MSHPLRLFVPAATPFRADLSPDPDRFVTHCRSLLEDGADGLAVFGTTSEATSLSVEERIELLEALVAAGIPPETLIPGTGCAALPDSIRLTRHAVGLGVRGTLTLPPFYYKAVPEDGVFAAYARVIEAVGSADLRLYLYHFPQMSAVPITLLLIARLLDAYPGTVVGLKDSSGDWDNTAAILKAFPGLEVYSSSESLLPKNAAAGGAGCISATANVNARGIVRLIRSIGGPEEAAAAADATEIRQVFEGLPLIPAIKATIARRFDDPGYAMVRPPLTPLPVEHAPDIDQAARLCFGVGSPADAA